jgi:hypothetical protein
MDTGTIILARPVQSIDPITGRPTQVILEDITTGTGTPHEMGLQSQAVGGIQQNWSAWKIRVRRAIFKDQTHLLAKFRGQDQLFTIQTFSPVFKGGEQDRSLIDLIVRTATDTQIFNLMVAWRNQHIGG